MSAYDNVVAGKLRLKDKDLDLKSSRIKKKKKHKHQYDLNDDHLTPAERKYLEQWEKLNIKRLAIKATKSHRDRIQDFNQYLANLTEHY
ncbi:unnamed protein product [Withania somnifera]